MEKSSHSQLINSIRESRMHSHPYRWSFVNNLFSNMESSELYKNFPEDYENFKNVDGYDGEKGFVYRVRPLVHLRQKEAHAPEKLSEQWKSLATSLTSEEYKQSMCELTGVDLSDADMEINAFHYTPGSWMGPHVDIKQKIVTHILYFNQEWDIKDGGNFTVLRSKDMSDAVVSVMPLIGNSIVLVRSDTSWHAVTKVKDECSRIRKNIIINFYPKGTETIMWGK